MYELIIVGGGPAGVAAGIYAARKKIKTLLVTDGFGGQSVVSNEIQNWIGTKSVSGLELAHMLEGHLRAQDGVEIIDDDFAAAVEKTDAGFRVKTRKGKTFETRYVLVASGSRRKKLGVQGEKEFDGKGVSYCSTCDAPLFKDKAVAVVGGGNAGLEAALDLLPYASKVYILEVHDSLGGDPLTREKVKNSQNVQIMCGTSVIEILGDNFVTGLKYKNLASGEIGELRIDGVFVEIGSVPNSDIVGGLAKLNERGEIIVDQNTQQSSCRGIWAAGDVSDVLYKQNNIAAGDAIKAVLNIYEHLSKR
jgi:alkyl hydroperoxide reductase subunit F